MVEVDSLTVIDAIRQALAAAPTDGNWELCYLDTPLQEIGAYVQKCVEASGGDKYHFIRAVREDGVPVDIAHYGNGPTSNVNGHWACVTRPAAIRAVLAEFDAQLAAERAEVERLREALEEIALAGMSPSPEMSENGVEAWHARRAWEFIGIAARAISPAALATPTQGETS